METMCEAVEILLVGDNLGDVRLTQEVWDGKVRNNMHVAKDGVDAISFLRRTGEYVGAPRPDIILLDLNLPKKDGREVFADIKADSDLKHISVVVLTTSSAEQDIFRSYDLHANCCITKPVNLDQFIRVLRSIEDFWLTNRETAVEWGVWQIGRLRYC